MEITPGSSGSTDAKRARAKPKVTAKGSSEAAPAAIKKPRTPRKTLTTKTPIGRPEHACVAEPIQEDVGSMIATAAYFRAAARNFTPGHELEDWLEAERSVHASRQG
jgi:hypothetical protein